MKLRIFDENDHDGDGWKEIEATKEFHKNLVDYFALDNGFAVVDKNDLDDVAFIEVYAKVREPAAIEMLRIITAFGIIHFALPEEEMITPPQEAKGVSDGN